MLLVSFICYIFSFVIFCVCVRSLDVWECVRVCYLLFAFHICVTKAFYFIFLFDPSNTLPYITALFDVFEKVGQKNAWILNALRNTLTNEHKKVLRTQPGPTRHSKKPEWMLCSQYCNTHTRSLQYRKLKFRLCFCFNNVVKPNEVKQMPAGSRNMLTAALQAQRMKQKCVALWSNNLCL